MLRLLGWAGAGVLAAATAANGQMLRPVQDAQLSDSRAIVDNPTASTPFALPAPQVTLETLKEGTEASATIGYARRQTTFRATFRSPIGKDPAAEASPLLLTGLSDSSNVEFAVTQIRLFKQYRDTDVLGFCEKFGVPASKCSDAAFAATPDRRRQFLGIALHTMPMLFNARVKVGRQRFDYRDPSTLARGTDRHTDYWFGVSWGTLVAPATSRPCTSTTSTSTSPGRSTELCTPIGETGALRCDNAVLGGPTLSEGAVLTLEWRYMAAQPSPPVAGKPAFGLAARFRRDFERDISSFEVPIYFLQQRRDKQTTPVTLNGGVNAGWESDQGFVARIFIGAGFRLLGI